MLSLLAAFTVAAGPTPPHGSVIIGRTARAFSTIAHSEWCPAGNVMLDMATGKFTLTRRAPRRICNEAGLERPTTRGELQGEALKQIRAAYLRAMTTGLENPDCRWGRSSDTIVVSNGGTPTLVLTSGQGTSSAPSELGCWSDAANALHNALDNAFPSAQQR